MKTVSVAEARARLPSLLQAAEAGEKVVVTRRGKPIAEVTPVRDEARRTLIEGLDWLAERRAARKPAVQDAASLIREMRDEGDH